MEISKPNRPLMAHSSCLEYLGNLIRTSSAIKTRRPAHHKAIAASQQNVPY